MDLHDFYYDLPEELIAQDPLSDRSSSRLMVLDKETGEIEHKIFRDIVDYLKPGDCLVVNDTKVIPARLIGTKADTGATIEVLLLKRLEDRQDTWEVLVKPGKKAKVGAKISFGEGKLIGEIIDIVEEGNRLIQFTYDGIFEEILDELGQMPLPPYITHKLEDKNRYQTVYAKHEGSAAAPTAGLHFTTELLEKIKTQMHVDNSDACNVFATSAVMAAYNESSGWLDELKKVLYKNKSIVRDYLANELPIIKLVESDATYLLWLDCSALGVSSKILSEFLRTNQGLFLSAGCDFGRCGDNFLRMNIACPEKLLDEGLRRLKAGIISLNNIKSF